MQFGFGRNPDRLFVRLDGDRRLADLLADGYTFSLKFLRPAGVRFTARMVDGEVVGVFCDRSADGDRRIERGPRGAVVVVGAILEAALPLGELAAPVDAGLAFFVVVEGPDSAELETHPEHHAFEATAPDDRFEARNWTA